MGALIDSKAITLHKEAITLARFFERRESAIAPRDFLIIFFRCTFFCAPQTEARAEERLGLTGQAREGFSSDACSASIAFDMRDLFRRHFLEASTRSKMNLRQLLLTGK